MTCLRFVLTGLLVLIAWGAISPAARAQSFRVETKLFINDERADTNKTLTLFDDGRIYDFILDGQDQMQEITIYDVKNARFYLLDVGRELRSEVTAGELASFSGTMKQRVEAESESIRQIVIPQFQEDFNETTGKLMLTSPRIIYEVQCRKAGVDEARQYNRFADWYSRLNATQPGNPPPFARLDLNEALAKRDLIPESVERTYKPANRVFHKTRVARAEHLFSWRLLESDRNRMAEAQRYQSRFQQVDFATYRDLDRLAQRN
jgi:hypothetical protein